jgi:excisionase family DNA binding protein
MSDEVPIFLTAEQVAALLQCSGNSVLRWKKDDPTMPCLRIGRTVRFPRAELLEWFRRKSQGFGRKKAQKTAHEAPGVYGSA